MSDKYKDFRPNWRQAAPAMDSYRSIFKWGDPAQFKHPNEKLYQEIKSIFNLNDADFKNRQQEGNEKVECRQKIRMRKAHIQALTRIVGEENVSKTDYDRVKYASGKTMEEAMLLRRGFAGRVADLVVYPRHKEDVKDVVAFCHQKNIPIYVVGGGSSVNFGLRPSRGGISLVLQKHMNKLLSINETNQTATVQAGMMGPAFEKALNQAPEIFSAKRPYTCGHFPQSFEYSSVGGWIVTLGSGQCSSYYGDAYDLVISQEYVTPKGSFKTLAYPATATGPKVGDIMKGSEGCFGVLVEATMKVFRYMPQNTQRFGFIFPSFKQAVDAAREVSQSEFGQPAIFRISDEEETHIGLKLYGIDGSVLDTMIRARGYKPMQRCLMLGSVEGELGFARNVKENIKKVCKQYKGLYISGLATKKWEPGRYKDPYLREDLNDYGIIIDTLETGVSWDQIHRVHQQVRQYIKARPNTICMTHGSHFYPQGTNLYFIFIAKIDNMDEYVQFQEGVIESISESGGSLSHHHGVGKMIAPWMEGHLGEQQMGILRAVKKYLDPRNIMNPGGQLGLDYCDRNWRLRK